MPFLKRDFAHPAFSDFCKRERALTLYANASGQLVAAYSYNTAIAVVLPDADQVGGVRVHLNSTTYSMGTSMHKWSVVDRLREEYGDAAVDAAADAHNVPVGTSAVDLAALCSGSASPGLPKYVRERPLAGHVHLTLADHRRAAYGDKIVGRDSGRDLYFGCVTRDGEHHDVNVQDGETDISEDMSEGDYTLSPDFYNYMIITQAKAAAVAEARGSAFRYGMYGGHVDLTYSKRSA